MKRSDNLSKQTKITITKVKTTLKGKSSGGKKRSTSSSSMKKSSTSSGSASRGQSKTAKKSSSTPTRASGRSKSPSQTPDVAIPQPAKPSRRGSTHHIGVVARGSYVKNLYEVTKGKEGAERLQAINNESRRIQNLVNKRIAKLTKLEAETGITSPALRQLRESGYGLGATSAWKVEHLQQAEENYKAVLDFLKDKTSTVSGTKKNIKAIEQELKDAGWSGDHMSPQQYDMFKALSEKFYSESSKYKWYLINGNRDQGEMRDRINEEIVNLLGANDLDAALKMADDRLEELYIQSQRGMF